jgi:phosphate transport system substrate-binding protein
MQFPTVIGGVMPVVNIKGITPGQLRLNGQVLGDIYLGKITKWNDPPSRR